jgi:tRNA nucleotidyltransferase (CCA-adding enzyme)
VLEAVGMLAAEMGRKAYLVGGIVRDIAIGYPNVDLDITIDGDDLEVPRTFAAKTGAAFKGATRFGTCKVESKAFGVIDFATTRAESYRRPGALPDVRPSDLSHDLARRDFTINAMAISLCPDDYGLLMDPHDGLGDIRRRRIRILHDESFIDDPTRILRAVRFASRYGFKLERKTRRLATECIEGGCLGTISGKRAFSELRLICREKEALTGLRKLKRLGVLGAINGSLAKGSALEHGQEIARSFKVLERLAGDTFASGWICWFSSLFSGVRLAEAQKISAYFNLPRDARDVCLWVAKELGRRRAGLLRLDPSNAYAVTKSLSGVPPEGLVHLYATSPALVRSAMRRYLADWRKVRPALSGGDIARMGIGQGPAVGRVLEHLLRGRLLGRIKSRAQEVAYVRRQLTSRR